ncbi:hypothetical protein AZH53_08245 [Methanomicrobiaceae archaeon CYW5]|nr:hypothetical protein [Methanovulcanius yangii]
MGALLVFLLVAVTGAAALTEDEISVLPDTTIITAGDEGALITVSIENASATIDRVTFSYLGAAGDPSGTLSVATDTSAPYQSRFTSTLAGDADIRVAVTYLDGGILRSTEKTCRIRVIPSDPYAYTVPISFADEVQVTQTLPITVLMEDMYGNTINNETGDTVDFWVSTEGTGFVDGATISQHVNVPFSADGECIVTFQSSTIAGPAIILVDPGQGSYLKRLVVIDMVAERIASDITAYIVTVPHYPVLYECPADGSSYFDMSYLVRDQYGNPISDYQVDFSTTLGETKTIFTNDNGLGRLEYGRRIALGNVTATAVAGTITHEQELIFTAGMGTDFAVSTNPNNLPSGDVDPSARIAVQARVFNDYGTGVAGETVTFWINSGTIWSSNNMTTDPGISLTGESGWTHTSVLTATTDVNGYATVYFKGGSFPVRGEEDFDPFCRGSCTITAMWNSESKVSPLITWRNYPYLRVETEVSEVQVAPGDTLNVSIRLIGDGNELLSHNPIDVVLCLDRGEDMLITEDKTGRDRMELAREAAMYLVGGGTTGEIGLTPGMDRVALISYSDPTTNDTSVFPAGTANILTVPTTFNWKKNVGKDGNPGDDETYTNAHYYGNAITAYSDYATLDYGFSYGNATDWSALEDVLNDVVPIKKDDTGQASAPLRRGLKDSVEYLETQGSSSSVKAIVLLMQNNYRYFGDPFADGSVMTVAPDSNTLPKGGSDYYPFAGLSAEQQNMARYAADNGIKIYAIYYPTGASVSDEAVPQRLANETGGEYYFAADQAALIEAFREIRDNLLRDAGVNTQVNLNFAGLPENFTYTASELLGYVPPTAVDFYNWSVDGYTPTTHLAGYPLSINQTDMWTGADGSDPTSLTFTVGNVTVKQTWMTEFTLSINESINQPVNFSLFADGSYVEFENQDGGRTLELLPSTIITVIPGLTPEGLINATVAITSFEVTDQDPNFVNLGWEISYNGDYPMTEELAIKDKNEPGPTWKTVGISTLPPEGATDSSAIYIADLPIGEYQARIHVATEDAGTDDAYLTFAVGDVNDDVYIRLT